MKLVFAAATELDKAGGAERSMLELAGGLAALGCEVEVLNLRFYDTPVVQPFYEIPAGVRLTQACLYPRKWSLPTMWKKLRSRVFARLYQLTSFSFFFYLKQQHVITTWRRQLQDRHPDVVIGFTPEAFVHLAPALRGSGIPFVCAVRTDPRREDFYSRHYREVSVAAREAAAVTTLLPQFTTWFPPDIREHTFVIPNAVAPVPADQIASPDRQEGEKVIIATGRMVSAKNFGLLIQAFALLRDRFPDWVVRIFGEPDEQEALQRLIQGLQLEDRVMLHTPVADIAVQLAKAQIYALPSLYEGMSRGLTEAMAHGLPAVVIHECDANRHLIEESGGGLISNNTPVDFANSLAALMGDAGARRRMGENARAYVHGFAPEMIYRQWYALLQSLVSTSKREQS
jgi:glycosyltransferase involved in cell wall biosynthesis